MSITTAVAAAADPVSGSTALVLIGLLVLFSWLGSLWLHPFTACVACNGSPRKFGAIATRSWRMCATCGGSGRRMRVGARMFARHRD